MTNLNYMKKMEKAKALKASEIITMAENYAVSVSPYPQDKVGTFDIPTYKAYYQGFRDAMRYFNHHLRKELTPET